jgi:hypothetical protein
MALVKYDKQNFLASLKPGISTLVVSEFEKKLEEKLNGIVESVYSELKEEIPKKIESRINSVLTHDTMENKVSIVVELKEYNKEINRT